MEFEEEIIFAKRGNENTQEQSMPSLLIGVRNRIETCRLIAMCDAYESSTYVRFDGVVSFHRSIEL
jgi:hypothetical protein